MSSYEDPDQTTLSIPSLVAFAIISFFTIRYFFFSSRNSSPASASGQTYPGGNAASRRSGAGIVSGGGGGGGGLRRNAAREKIETIATMFPQLSRRDIEWDLERNGGSVQATTERVLREGRLPVPPPNFVAQETPAATVPTAGSRTAQQSSTSKSPQHPDLITRYNLSGRVAFSTPTSGGDDDSESSADTIQSKAKQLSKGSWSSSKVERAELLKHRREEMILAARRKMEDKDRKGKERETVATSPSSS